MWKVCCVVCGTPAPIFEMALSRREISCAVVRVEAEVDDGSVLSRGGVRGEMRAETGVMGCG